MAKKKKKGGSPSATRARHADTAIKIHRKPTYDYNTYKLRHALWARRTVQTFRKDEPGLATSAIVTKTIRPNRPEKIPKKYIAFQPEQRVTSCDQKRERRRRAYFGYLQSPHAGKGASKRSPRGDRFTVKC